MNKKQIMIPAVVCAACILLAGVYTCRLRHTQIEKQKVVLRSSVTQMKRQVDAFLAEARGLTVILPSIITKQGYIEDEVDVNSQAVTLYQQVLSRHPFVKKSSVLDQHSNVFNLTRDETGLFLNARYKAVKANVITAHENIYVEGSSDYIFTFPILSDGVLTGNLSVTFDMTTLLDTLYSTYLKEHNGWLTAVLPTEDIAMTFPLDAEYMLSNVLEIADMMDETKDSAFTEGYIGNDAEEFAVISYYQRFTYSGRHLGVVASADISGVIHSARLFFVIACILFVLLTLAFVFLLKYNTRHLQKTNEEQSKQLTLYQTVLQDVSVGLLLFRDEELITANEFALDLLSDFIKPSDAGLTFPPDFLAKQDDSQLDECSLFSFEKFGNEIHLLKNRSDMRIGNEHFTVIVFSNVTELEKNRKYAAHSELAKSELLSRLSRDFKRPLDRIHEAIVLMAQRYPEDTSVQHIIVPITFITESLANMQDFGDIESGNVILDELPFTIAEAVNEVANEYRAEVNRKGLKLTVKTTPASAQKVVGDAIRFQHILSQLLSNAVKFTDSGEIRVSVDMTSIEENKALIRCSVEDTGKGMNVDELKNIFSLETRTKNGKSIGLGTIIAKQLVNIFGGNILVSSPSSISQDPSTPGAKVFFTVRCHLDVTPHKALDYSAITAYKQLRVLIITTDAHNVKYQINDLQRKSIQSDVFLYNKEVTGMLLANKLIIDKNRYQIIIIDTNDEETGFTIAAELNEKGLTQQYIFAFVDAYQQPGHYLRAKHLQMDYYLDNKEDLTMIDKILSEKFPSLIRSEASLDMELTKDIRILMCEHNPLSQAVSRLIFTRLGYQVDCVANSAEMRSAMKQVAYDIMFIDLSFPPTNALELTTQLRKEGNKILIIAITSNVSKENIKAVVNAGMNGYLQKPLNRDAVKQLIHKWFM
ncbi:hypothetical protein FACS189430_02650 [Bacteroidia bacterium]|nr:hypothetical protein FACS189430_02650 [Bacteroidia bacterium]